MRHIPEDELHAYLDQGLSRSQCVEIESHLAGCSSCRANRDGIAAMRDRTTALLAKLAPPRRFPPLFDTLQAEALKRVSTRRRRVRAGAWAASLVAAVGLGWGASDLVNPAPSAVADRTAAAVPTVTIAPVEVAPVEHLPVDRPVPAVGKAPETPAVTVRSEPDQERKFMRAVEQRVREDSLRAAKLAVLDQAPPVELAPLERPSTDAAQQFDGLWRTISWDGARNEAGEELPHIDGLPVLQVQVQAGEQGRRPLMVVAQQLSSGQVIQTIEGPASDVSQLLSRRTAISTASTSGAGKMGVTISEAAPPPDQAMAMQVGDRMIAITGALPSDSLRAMIRRINAEMRSK